MNAMNLAELEQKILFNSDSINNVKTRVSSMELDNNSISNIINSIQNRTDSLIRQFQLQDNQNHLKNDNILKKIGKEIQDTNARVGSLEETNVELDNDINMAFDRLNKLESKLFPDDNSQLLAVRNGGKYDLQGLNRVNKTMRVEKVDGDDHDNDGSNIINIDLIHLINQRLDQLESDIKTIDESYVDVNEANAFQNQLTEKIEKIESTNQNLEIKINELQNQLSKANNELMLIKKRGCVKCIDYQEVINTFDSEAFGSKITEAYKSMSSLTPTYPSAYVLLSLLIPPELKLKADNQHHKQAFVSGYYIYAQAKNKGCRFAIINHPPTTSVPPPPSFSSVSALSKTFSSSSATTQPICKPVPYKLVSVGEEKYELLNESYMVPYMPVINEFGEGTAGSYSVCIKSNGEVTPKEIDEELICDILNEKVRSRCNVQFNLKFSPYYAEKLMDFPLVCRFKDRLVVDQDITVIF